MLQVRFIFLLDQPLVYVQTLRSKGKNRVIRKCNFHNTAILISAWQRRVLPLSRPLVRSRRPFTPPTGKNKRGDIVKIKIIFASPYLLYFTYLYFINIFNLFSNRNNSRSIQKEVASTINVHLCTLFLNILKGGIQVEIINHGPHLGKNSVALPAIPSQSSKSNQIKLSK